MLTALRRPTSRSETVGAFGAMRAAASVRRIIG